MVPNTFLTAAVTLWCLSRLYALVGPARFKDSFAKLKHRFGLSKVKNDR
jgi:hypothetical protein